MENQRNEEAGTSEAKEEVMDLMICITQENINVLREAYKSNHHNAALDELLNLVRETMIERIKERYNIDLS